MLETFLRNHLSTFKGRYDPDGTQTWLKEVERIFRVMQCGEVQKVRFGTHMLAEEADDWWVSVLPILENGGGVVTWAVMSKTASVWFYRSSKKRVPFQQGVVQFD